MKLQQKGFTLITALSLILILTISAGFLGQVITRLKSTKLKTQARISSLGYEDSMAILMISNVVRQINSGCAGDAASLNSRETRIPGTQVNMKIDSINPNTITDAIGTMIIKTTLTLPPDIPGGVSERFIDNPAKVNFRLEFLNKGMSQNGKMFDPPISCSSFRVLPQNKKQIKIAYSVEWTYRDKKLATSGTRLFNLEEIGL